MNVSAGRRSCRAALLGLVALAVAFDATAEHKQHWGQVQVSGSPAATDVAGQAYNFTPTASAPGGYSLTFAISGKPAWASFNTATGQLSGTPTASDVGTYSNIVIRASDQYSSASLAPFSITVNQVSNGAATINWTPPLSNTNGSTLTNLAGYKIYYGTASNSLTQNVQVATTGIASYTLGNLSSGTWYFAVTAYNSSGTESALSGIVSKAIP